MIPVCQHSHACPRTRGRTRLLAGALAAAVLGLVSACGGGGDDVAGNGTGISFAASPIATERYATVENRDANPQVGDAAVQEVVDGFNGFSLDVHRQLVATAPADNAISSGYSIAVAVSLLRASAAGEIDSSFANLLGVGAVAEADLHRALNRLALDLESRGNDELLLRMANRLLISPQRAFNDTFLDIAAGQYGAPATEIDFLRHTEEARQLINAWVDDRTDGMIPELLTELSPDTVAMIVNAILLDALWQKPFEPRGDRVFTGIDAVARDVAMFGDTRSLRAYQDNALSAVEIPYAGGELAMLLAMPASAFSDYEASLTQADLATLRDSLRFSQVMLTMPEWQAETRFDPQELLASAGFPGNPMPLDDLLDETSPKSLYELAAVHQAVIEVDRFGTRAAAATAIGVVDASAPDIDYTISVDRPFLYFLIDRPTGLVLFGGRVVNL